MNRVTSRTQQGQTARDRLLEASVAQLAEGGMRELTHRKIERRAGVAQGSAKYYFGSSEGLIKAVLTHLLDEELPLVLDVDPHRTDSAPEEDASALLVRAQHVIDAVMSRPDRTLARFHLYLHCASHPSLQALVAAARDAFVERIARSLPGPSPEIGARFVCATVDGMLLDQLSAPDPAVDADGARYLLAAGRAAAELAAGRPPPSR